MFSALKFKRCLRLRHVVGGVGVGSRDARYDQRGISLFAVLLIDRDTVQLYVLRNPTVVPKRWQRMHCTDGLPEIESLYLHRLDAQINLCACTNAVLALLFVFFRVNVSLQYSIPAKHIASIFRRHHLQTESYCGRVRKLKCVQGHKGKFMEIHGKF